MNTNKHKNSGTNTQFHAVLKEKFDEWRNILVGGDIHSIRNQIYDMIFDSAIFQCINESRKYAAKDDKGDVRQNKMLRYFINQSFFKTQLLSIRRLVDKDFNRINKNRPCTVYSLYNLIEDMKKNRTLFTRENILAVYDLPYDYEKEMAALDYTKGPVIVPQNIAHSEDIHRQIDSITGVAADKRSREDLLPDSILNQATDELVNIDGLCKYVDKFIAHAATPESRLKIPDVNEALGRVLNAHEILCRASRSLEKTYLFCGFGSVLSISQCGKFDQFDLFEYLDEPIASKETIEELREFWEKYRTETEQWIL